MSVGGAGGVRPPGVSRHGLSRSSSQRSSYEERSVDLVETLPSTQELRFTHKADPRDANGNKCETIGFIPGSAEPASTSPSCNPCASPTRCRSVFCTVLTCGLYRFCQRSTLAPCLAPNESSPDEPEKISLKNTKTKESMEVEDDKNWLNDVHIGGVRVEESIDPWCLMTGPGGCGDVDSLITKKLLELYSEYQIEELARCTTDSIFLKKTKDIHQLINSLAEEHQMDEQEAECRLVRGIIRISTRKSKKKPHISKRERTLSDSGHETMKDSGSTSFSNNNDYKSHPNIQISELTSSDKCARQMWRNNGGHSSVSPTSYSPSTIEASSGVPFSRSTMDKIYCLLKKYRLQSYYSSFQKLGVVDEKDLVDSVTDEDLTSLGFTHVEKNRFRVMQKVIDRPEVPVLKKSSPEHKSVSNFSLKYIYPLCPEAKLIPDMDPAQNTMEDLMQKIRHAENIESSKGVCLYTLDGMPLTDDPFFNTWSLQDRHIKDGEVIYAIFTLGLQLTIIFLSINLSIIFSINRLNLRIVPKIEKGPVPQLGTDTVCCHVMLKGDFEVNVDLSANTIADLKNKLSEISGIPSNVLHYRGDTGSGNTLLGLGITEGKTLNFSLSSFTEDPCYQSDFFIDDVAPSVQQTKKGMSVFLASLYAIKHKPRAVDLCDLISFIRKTTGCNPLAQSLHQMLQKNHILSRIQKIAVIEGLYTLFREILPKPGSADGDVIEDHEVFEHSLLCWSYIMSETKEGISEYENYAPISLVSDRGKRFCEPVTVPGLPDVMERAVVLQKIRDGKTIPLCTEQVLLPTSLKRCTDIEKILLSVHPSMKTYSLWISYNNVSGMNFQLEIKKVLEVMKEEMKAFPILNVVPPLLLKDLGHNDACLVYLSEDNLGIYLMKDKTKPELISVYDCLEGKTQSVDVDVLAALTGDHRNDQSLATTRIPKEAVLVLIDTSSSMNEKCYGSVDIRRIHAVKELFNNYANRSMAYNFHHIIGLVKFDSTVKTLQTFTETLETFKDSVQSLEANGVTLLYDALEHGRLELEKVKAKFPDCLLRILCLTDGNDVGSSVEPADVAVSLINSNIIVDSVLLGEVENNMLHGISIASGGCCFKPETSKDGLKLFETETVLSLGIRKPKTRADPWCVSEEFVTALFSIHGYDDFPEAVLPQEIANKVTVTEDALKKKILESKDARFMEQDRRILEELKNLHCHPHPFFQIFPSETDFTFWKMLMEGPPDTPYEGGVFELFCQFGPDYPVKPPTMYHCNINNVGRICHNIFDRGYNAHITMRDILDAVYGLLIAPEPQDPLDSILAEEYLTTPKKYEEEAKKHTQKSAGQSLDEMEKRLVEDLKALPEKLICPLTKKMYVDPVITQHNTVYERKAIEKHLKTSKYDPLVKPQQELKITDCKPCPQMKAMVTEYRSSLLETSMEEKK
ncbi:hypothetical protein WMY93_019664 [Mugilogobius chulae]|uniref:Uncharacterized protein n=1 Tax=Mugilogobius chulae TaxID=88201 RepID=A0AAW0NRT2_9GOBI